MKLTQFSFTKAVSEVSHVRFKLTVYLKIHGLSNLLPPYPQRWDYRQAPLHKIRGAGNQIQCFVHSRQALDQLSYTPRSN